MNSNREPKHRYLPPPPTTTTLDQVQVSHPHWPNPARPGHLLLSPLNVDRPDSQFVWHEQYRHVPEISIDEATSLDNGLRAADGHGLQSTVIVNTGQQLIGDEYNVQECQIDPATGAIVVAASISHYGFAMQGGFDLGIRTSQNLFKKSHLNDEPSFGMAATSIYAGNLRTGRLEMLYLGGQVGALALSPDTGSVATIEWVGPQASEGGNQGFIYEYGLDSGRRRLMGCLPYFSGSGKLHYSPDGKWLLIEPNVLLRVSDGYWVTLPECMGSAWSPIYGPSSIVQIVRDGHSGINLIAFDLATNATSVIGSVSLMQDSYRVSYINEVDMHPVTGDILCSVQGWGNPEYGLRSKVAMIHPGDEVLHPITEPLYSGFEQLEREQSHGAWIVDRRGADVAVSDELVSGMNAPDLRGVTSARLIIDLALNSIIVPSLRLIEPNRPRRDPALVRVELLRALLALWRIDRALFEANIPGIRDFISPMSMLEIAASDPKLASVPKPMASLGVGLQVLEEGRADKYDWDAEAYYS